MISEKNLCSDWLTHFSFLKRHRSGRKLLCRYDSVVYGIELEKMRFDDSRYRPNFIAMCLLGNPVEFSINQVLRTERVLQYEVQYLRHSEEYGEAVSLMKEQAPLLSNCAPCPEDIIVLFRKQIALDHSEGRCPLGLLLSLVQLATFYGYDDIAANERQELLTSISPAKLELMGTDFRSFFEDESSMSADDLKLRYSENLQRAGWFKLPVRGNT